MRSITRWTVLFTLALILIAPFAVYAQMGGSIEGNVVEDTSGFPLPGVRVHAFLPDSILRMPVSMAITDSTGHYVMPIMPGNYIVFACKLGFICEWYDNVLRPDQATIIHVGMGQHVTGINFGLVHLRLPSYFGSIAGQVTDSITQLPIAGAMVAAHGQIGMNMPGYVTRTDSSGNYLFPAVLPDTYRVAAFALGYLPGGYPQPVGVDSGQHVIGIDIQLLPLPVGSISGRVTNRLNNTPVGHALIVAHRIDGFGYGRAFTDSTGNYLIPALPAGFYKVVAMARGYFPERYPDSVGVRPGENTPHIDFALTPALPPGGGHIAGTVTDDSTGMPIPGAIIAALGFDSLHHMPVIRFAFSHEDGQYLIEHLPIMPYFVIACARGYLAEIYDNVHRFEDATRVTPDADGIDFALAPRSMGASILTGIVTHQQLGTPLPGVMMNLMTMDNQLAGATISLPNGSFMLEGIMPGEYKLQALTNFAPPVTQGPMMMEQMGQNNFQVSINAPVLITRGDANQDGMIDITDVVAAVGNVFFGQSIDTTATDVDCNAVVDISDIVHLIQFVFYNTDTLCSLN